MKPLLALTAITIILFAVVTVVSNAEDTLEQQPRFAGQVLFVSTGGKAAALENVRFVEVQGRMMMIGDEITTVGNDDDKFYPTGVTIAIAWDKVVQYASKSTKHYKQPVATERAYLGRQRPDALERLDRKTAPSDETKPSP